jgi:hypothetical protein
MSEAFDIGQLPREQQEFIRDFIEAKIRQGLATRAIGFLPSLVGHLYGAMLASACLAIGTGCFAAIVVFAKITVTTLLGGR